MEYTELYLVHHNKKFLDFPLEHKFAKRGPVPIHYEDLELVAMVRIPKGLGLNKVFELTNHIDHDWTENPGVTAIDPQARHRSTSVGDLICDITNSKAWVVAAVGFVEADIIYQPDLNLLDD